MAKNSICFIHKYLTILLCFPGELRPARPPEGSQGEGALSQAGPAQSLHRVRREQLQRTDAVDRQSEWRPAQGDLHYIRQQNL